MKHESRTWIFFPLGLLLLLAGFGSMWMIRPGGEERMDPVILETSRASIEASIHSAGEAISPVPANERSAGGIRPAQHSAPLTQDMGDASAQAGWRYIESGDYERAERLFTEASRRFPHDPSVQLGLGISHSRMTRDHLAIAALNRALSLDPHIDHAHALLGDLYFKHDDLEASVQHYEAAARQVPTDTAVQDALFAARRAYRAEAQFHRVYSPHFVVKFESSHRRIANDVVDRLEEQYRVIGGRLGWTAKEPMIVILYSDRGFKEWSGSPAWAGGLYDGKIHLAAGTVMKKGKPAGAALAHEYTHAIVHRLSGGHAPTWLQEGLALYFEGRPVAWSRRILARHQRNIMPLHALHGSFLGLSPQDADLAYAEGHGATRALIEQYGFVKVRQLLAALATAPEFGAAFEGVFHQPYRNFETAWLAGLTDRRA